MANYINAEPDKEKESDSFPQDKAHSLQRIFRKYFKRTIKLREMARFCYFVSFHAFQLISMECFGSIGQIIIIMKPNLYLSILNLNDGNSKNLRFNLNDLQSTHTYRENYCGCGIRK